MKIIELNILKNEYNSFVVNFSDRTTEKDNFYLEIIKNKIIKISSYLVINRIINIEDLESLSFYISNEYNPKPLRNNYIEKTFYIKYSIDSSGDNEVTYYWAEPFTKQISNEFIRFFESDENSIKILINHCYNFNTIDFKIKSSK